MFLNNILIKQVAQTAKNLPVMQETWVRSLGWDDPLEEGMAAHSSILAWRIPMGRGAWQAAVHRVANSLTLLSNMVAQRKCQDAVSIMDSERRK